MDEHIVNNQDEFLALFKDRVLHGDTVYICNPFPVAIHFYADSLSIYDLTNAMIPGKVCERINLDAWTARQSGYAPIHDLLYEIPVHEIFSVFREWMQPFKEETRYGVHYQQVDFMDSKIKVCYENHTCSIRVFSPFVKVKPLAAAPKKWTVALIVRAMLAGQTSLHCDGHYTDDYAYDAVVDFGRGGVDPAWKAKKILESPSGWRCYKSAPSEVSLHCHSFDNYTVTLAPEISG